MWLRGIYPRGIDKYVLYPQSIHENGGAARVHDWMCVREMKSFPNKNSSFVTLRFRLRKYGTDKYFCLVYYFVIRQENVCW